MGNRSTRHCPNDIHTCTMHICIRFVCILCVWHVVLFFFSSSHLICASMVSILMCQHTQNLTRVRASETRMRTGSDRCVRVPSTCCGWLAGCPTGLLCTLKRWAIGDNDVTHARAPIERIIVAASSSPAAILHSACFIAQNSLSELTFAREQIKLLSGPTSLDRQRW